MKKLIPALALLLVSAVLLATSSFAWFSMNKEVTVTGMTVTTKVDSNLFVTASTAGTSKSADSAFGSYADQVVVGKLQPSSSIDAVTFYHTSNADAIGRKESGVYNLVTGNTIASEYQAYVDYVVELKAVNTEAATSYIKINTLNLTYNNAAITTEKAYRVGIFVQAQNGENAYAAQGATADAIYRMTGATYFTNDPTDKAVTTDDAVETPTATSTTLAAVTNLDASLATAMPVSAGATGYYKVTVRLWLEGEDTTCNNTTFKTLNGDWKLQLGFSIAGGASSVSAISSTLPSPKYTLTQTLTNVTSNVAEGDVIGGYAFTATYTAADNYDLPSTITVAVGGNTLTAGTDYTWTQGTGVLVINSTAITGNVTVTVAGVAQ